MVLFGISDEHILAKEEGTDRHAPAEGVRLVYNQTDPLVIRDGVDYITVVPDGPNRYELAYGGYLAGLLVVTEEGVAELGATLLANRREPPRWLVDPETVDEEALPWWVPDGLDIDPTSTCDRCTTDCPADAIVTPSAIDDKEPSDRFCRDCWDEVRTDYRRW